MQLKIVVFNDNGLESAEIYECIRVKITEAPENVESDSEVGMAEIEHGGKTTCVIFDKTCTDLFLTNDNGKTIDRWSWDD